MPRHFLLAVFVLFIFGLNAQMTFHRGYPLKQQNGGFDPDTSIFNITATQLKDKSYLSLDGILPVGDSTFHYLVLTNYDIKGDLNWSRSIKFSDEDLRINPGFCSLFQASNDSIYFSFTLFNGDKLKAIGATDKNGEGPWIKILSKEETQISSSNSNMLVEGKDSLLYNLTNYDTDDEPELIWSKLDKAGNIQLSQKLNLFNNDGLPIFTNVINLVNATDSTFLFTGTASTESTFPQILFSIADKNTNSTLNKTYGAPDAVNLPILGGTKVVKVANEYVIAGQYWDLDPFDFLNSYLGSFIMKTDASGNVIWSKVIDANISFINIISGLTIGNDNNIYISGSVINDNFEFVPFIVSLKNNGEQNWYNTYDRALANFTAMGSLFSTEDKGLAYFQSDIEDQANSILKTGFIKTDLEGKTTCENISTLKLLVDVNLSEDTLQSSIETISSEFNTELVRQETFSLHDVPVLFLDEKNFCPNEQVDFTFRPEVKGAVKWVWGDGSTADTLRVFDVGQYNVTITIDDKYCFELCDTTELKRLAVPTVTAARGGQVCEGANFIIIATPNVEAVPFTTIWSSGEINLNSISQNTLGTYTITVTDDCQETATATVVVDQSIWFGPPVATINQPSKVCENTPFIINAVGTSPAGGDLTYLWSTNETSQSITKTQLGTYTVTVTDRCNKTVTASINVTNSIYFAPPTVATAFGGELVCIGGDILLAASATAESGVITTIAWSNGQFGPTTIVNELRTYTVTVTDGCGKTVIGSITPDDSRYYKVAPGIALTNNIEDYCNDGAISLTASASASGFGIAEIKWSSGQTTTNTNVSNITVTDLGEYKVTVTDECGNTNEASLNVEDPSIIADSCVGFPLVFLPGSSPGTEDSISAELNKLFGAYSYCSRRTDSLTIEKLNLIDFEMRVYNRWGKEVFVSDDPLKRWNARKDDGEQEFYPADVYVWYATYKIGEFCQSKRKGDVTLMR